MLHFSNEEERLEYRRKQLRESQARYYKKHKKKIFAKQKEKRHKLKIESNAHENLRGNILSKLYSHPKNTFTRTELQRMKKPELMELLKRLDGDIQ